MKDLKSKNNSQTSEWQKPVALLRSSCSAPSFNNSFKHDGKTILDASSPQTAEALR